MIALLMTLFAFAGALCGVIAIGVLALERRAKIEFDERFNNLDR